MNKAEDRFYFPIHQPMSATEHQWLKLAAGRVCESCLAVQATGEFDDTVTCFSMRRLSSFPNERDAAFGLS